MTTRHHPRIRQLAIVATCVVVAAGCRSGTGSGWNPFSSAPSQTAPSSQNPQPGSQAGNASPPGAVQASYNEPRYVPPPSIRPEDLIKDEDLSTYAGEKKSWLESTTENMSPGSITKGFKKLIGRGPNESLARSKYDEGEALYRQGKYKEAVKCFKVAADRYPDSSLEEDALFMLGESYFFQDMYPKASDTYAMLIKKYENTRYLTDITPRQFAIARYWDLKARIDSHWYPNLKDKTRPMVDATGHAISVYKSVHIHDPTGPLADDAMMATANLHFMHNRFEDAALDYEQVRKNPHSRWVREAHLLGIRAKLRCYQGPQYEITPLNDADQLIETTLTQFPASELGEERDRLISTRNLIRQEKAQREFQSAEYYYKIRYYKAARYYYAETMRDYADTPFAKMSEERLEEIKSYPDVPKDYFAWLKKALPESEKNR
ncbi:MAG TPA: outer membrane protein assembly factor BamD [Pirellulales bacterium]|nr:outer membrane protein assembly factor BamD [Pirellulales bacterium]